MSRLGQREGGHRRQVAHVHEGRPAAPYRDHDVVMQPDVISVGSAEVLHEERHAQKDVLQARAFQVLPDGVVRHQRIALRPLNRQEGHGPDACCPHGIDGRIDQLLRVADLRGPQQEDGVHSLKRQGVGGFLTKDEPDALSLFGEVRPWLFRIGDRCHDPDIPPIQRSHDLASHVAGRACHQNGAHTFT
jgi:hypothetical protein